MMKRLAILTALCALTACEVGPDYTAPKRPAGAEGPLLSGSARITTPAQPTDAWWHLYQDSRLDGYLAEAFAANDDLNAAEANLSAARATLEAARSGFFPSTTAVAGAVYGRNADTDKILELGGHKPVSTWAFDTILDASYELDLFGRVRRSVESAHASIDAVTAARDTLKVTVAAETARAYAQICTSGEQLTTARHSLDVVTREADISQRRYAAGAGSQLDVVRSRTLVSQVRATIPPLEGQRRAALFELAALLGRAPAKAPTEALACIQAPRLAGLIAIGDGKSLLARRPDIRQAERSLAAATANIGVATADLYPRVSITGSFGNVGGHTDDFFHERALTWGVGPSITWAFPNQMVPRARIAQAKAQAQVSLDRFDGAVLGALKETEQALSRYNAELDRRQALVEAESEARQAYDLAHDQVLAGAASPLDLLTSEQTLVSADAAVATSDAAMIDDQIAVFKALGGGWQAP